MAKLSTKEFKKRVQKVSVLLLDVDGILTSGLVNILGNGDEIYTFNVYDGYGIKLWSRAGFKVGFITGRGAEAVKRRAEKLGVDFLYQNSGDKLQICQEIAKKEEFSLENAVFFGDDLQDLPALKNVGLAIAPPNARKEVKKVAHYVTKAKGGDGAVRELIEMLLDMKGLWKDIISQERIFS